MFQMIVKRFLQFCNLFLTSSMCTSACVGGEGGGGGVDGGVCQSVFLIVYLLQPVGIVIGSIEETG